MLPKGNLSKSLPEWRAPVAAFAYEEERERGRGRRDLARKRGPTCGRSSRSNRPAILHRDWPVLASDWPISTRQNTNPDWTSAAVYPQSKFQDPFSLRSEVG